MRRFVTKQLENISPSWTHVFLFSMIGISMYGCPEKPSEDPVSEIEPTLILSSAPPCTEHILPTVDLDIEGVMPKFIPLEIRVNGMSGAQASELTTKLSFDPPVARACFLSAVSDESGEIQNLQCASPSSDNLSFQGGRTFDAFYCTKEGRFSVKAKTTLSDDTVLESNSIEIICLSETRFEDNCELVGEEELDLSVDMELDLGMPDMGEEVIVPASWSIVFAPDQEAITNLSVQASTSAYPKNATYHFSVIDQSGAPLENVPVRFYLDWSPLEGYPTCNPVCAIESTQESCDARTNCLWNFADETETITAGSDEVEETDEEAGDSEPSEPQGVCLSNPMTAGIDERCAQTTERCEANLCLPSSISALPLAIEPFESVTKTNGLATVSVVTSTSPGIYSLRAVATYNGREQEAHTPSLTIWHQIPSQEHISINCQAPVVAGYSRRMAPNSGLGTDERGYVTYQRAGAECKFQVADRFAGRVMGAPIFYMSEAGNIIQSVMSNEEGLAVATWHTGGRSPIDVEPAVWAMPFIDSNGNTICDPDEAVIPLNQDLTGSYIGGCGGSVYENKTQFFYPEAIGQRPLVANPRDGLVRIVGFTQGEARFIDLGDNLEGDGDGLYQPSSDLVPPHNEPYVDANDNGSFDQGEEEYQDINRNGEWDADVFGRDERDIELLKCVERAIPFINRGINPNLPDCDISDTEDLIDAIDDLKDRNPSSLQATIWTGMNILSVGLPRLDDALTVKCDQIGDACREELDQTYPCTGAPNGLPIYLNLTRPDHLGAVKVSFSPRDDNLNCIGVVDVSYNVSNGSLQSQDLTMSSYVPNNTLNSRTFTIGQDYTPVLEECFDEFRPLVPAGENYHWMITGQGEVQEDVDPNAAPVFDLVTFEVRVDYPDHSIINDSAFTHRLTRQVGVCR